MAEAVIGLNSLERKLKKLERPNKTIAKGINNYFQDITKHVERRPPETSANRPPAPYYVRNRGTFTGKKNDGKSQQSSKRWKWEDAKPILNGARGTIENEATYAPYVFGKRQARFHSMRGWPRTDKIVDATKHQAVKEIAKEIEKILKK